MRMLAIAVTLVAVVLSGCGQGDGGGGDDSSAVAVSIEQALASESGRAVRVSGHVVATDDVVVLASALLESYPPQAGGAVLPVRGISHKTSLTCLRLYFDTAIPFQDNSIHRGRSSPAIGRPPASRTSRCTLRL